MYGKAISKLNHDLNMELTTNLSEFLTNFDAITHKQEKIIKEMVILVNLISLLIALISYYFLDNWIRSNPGSTFKKICYSVSTF